MGHETTAEACWLLAARDGWRYIIYPDSGSSSRSMIDNLDPFPWLSIITKTHVGECCRACNASIGCGIVRPDWLQQNSSFVGTKTISGLSCNGWLKVRILSTLWDNGVTI